MTPVASGQPVAAPDLALEVRTFLHTLARIAHRIAREQHAERAEDAAHELQAPQGGERGRDA